MRRFTAVSAVAAAVALVLGLGVQPALAVTYAEVGDAGDLPATAQTATASPLTAVSGALAAGTDEDMYRICLPGGGTFSATTVGTGTAFDTQLFLFNASGVGVYANDDSSGTLQSTLPAGNPLTPAAPGLYYLAISSFNNDPFAGATLIFPSSPFTGVFGPTTLSPITTWSNAGGGTGAYTINLTGASACDPPVLCAALTSPPPGAIVGTPGNDVLNGTPGDDVIFGLGGDDVIVGGGGNDVLVGGPGRDRIDGGTGNDLLCGGDGNDTLVGSDGNDGLSGDNGDDVLSGGLGDDNLAGGAGNDRQDGGPGTNVSDGGTGTDICTNPAPPGATNCP